MQGAPQIYGRLGASAHKRLGNSICVNPTRSRLTPIGALPLCSTCRVSKTLCLKEENRLPRIRLTRSWRTSVLCRGRRRSAEVRASAGDPSECSHVVAANLNCIEPSSFARGQGAVGDYFFSAVHAAPSLRNPSSQLQSLPE
jgi:hypothetical protein